MPRRRATLLQGTLDLLILKALAPGPLHGLGVSRRIEQVTRGTFVVQPGSLFPALHRLEEAGWVDSDWQPSTSNYKDYREYAWGEGWKVWVAIRNNPEVQQAPRKDPFPVPEYTPADQIPVADELLDP